MKRPLLWFVAFLIVAGLFMLGTSQSKAAEKPTFALVQAQAIAVLDDRVASIRRELNQLRQQQECVALSVDLRSMSACGPLPQRRREP